jgi:hypothetical protein
LVQKTYMRGEYVPSSSIFIFLLPTLTFPLSF